MREHDATAFRRLLAADAVFDAADGHPLRGPAAIVPARPPIIEGKALQRDGQPVQVVTSADGPRALSGDPYVMTTTGKDGQVHTVIGRFAMARGGCRSTVATTVGRRTPRHSPRSTGTATHPAPKRAEH